MATEPVYPDSVEPDDFWEENKTKIILYGVLILLALGAFGVYQWVTVNRRDAANALFSGAESEAALREVIAKFPGSAAAGSAGLELGNQLRKDGKYAEAITALEAFIQNNPKHPLVCAAWLSLGTTHEVEGKPEEAFAAYEKALTGFPEEFSAPLALMAQARIRDGQGNQEEAIRLYQEVETRFPANTVAREAAQQLQRLRRNPPKTAPANS